MDEKELQQILGERTNLEQRIIDNIQGEVDKAFTDIFHHLHLIGEIVLNAQQFEGCLRKYLSMNGVNESNIWRTGKLITVLETKKLFTERETEILRKIIELRNWVVHELYEQEQQRLFLNDYRDKKLAVTKHFLYEAIDFVNDKIDKQNGRSGVANVINNSYNK